jgi:hypothetical protein
MFTAADAHRISQNVGEQDHFEKYAKRIADGILYGIRSDANAGFHERSIDLDYCPKEVRELVICKLENLGYNVKKRGFFYNFLLNPNLYVVSW